MKLRVGDMQHAALTIYVFDALDEDEAFPGELSSTHLTIDDGQENHACRLITDGANSADSGPGDEPLDPQDREMRDALTALCRRIRGTANRASH